MTAPLPFKSDLLTQEPIKSRSVSLLCPLDTAVELSRYNKNKIFGEGTLGGSSSDVGLRGKRTLGEL